MTSLINNILNIGIVSNNLDVLSFYEQSSECSG